MLCLRKVSVRNISMVQLCPSHYIVKFEVHCQSGQASSITLNTLTNMAAILVSMNRSMWLWPFVCDLCSPVPSISWRRADGNPLPGKIKINHSSGILEIPYFRPEDAGVYECVAENSRGRNVARGQLLFHSKNYVFFCFLSHVLIFFSF